MDIFKYTIHTVSIIWLTPADIYWLEKDGKLSESVILHQRKCTETE